MTHSCAWRLLSWKYRDDPVPAHLQDLAVLIPWYVHASLTCNFKKETGKHGIIGLSIPLATCP